MHRFEKNWEAAIDALGSRPGLRVGASPKKGGSMQPRSNTILTLGSPKKGTSIFQNAPPPCVWARGGLWFRVQGFRGSEIQGFRGSGVQGFRGSGVQGFRGSGVRGFGGSGVRGFGGSGVRGFGGSGVRGFGGFGVWGFGGSGLPGFQKSEFGNLGWGVGGPGLGASEVWAQP